MRANLLALLRRRRCSTRGPSSPATRRTRAPRDFVRVERQMLLRLPATRAVVFSIHTYMVRPEALTPSSAPGSPRSAPAPSPPSAGVRVFVLTGAGVSAESGLGTFRDKGGIWARFDPMKLATPEAFARDPAAVHAFYNMRRRNLLAAKPNAAHAALAGLEAGLAARGGALFLCTQNIDDLHERAGSRAVHHMHGELLKARCARCGRRDAVAGRPVGRRRPARRAAGPGAMRPDVVWFGEMPRGLDRIEAALARGRALRRHRHLGRGLPGGGLRRRGAGARHPDGRAQPRALGQRPRLRRARATGRRPRRCRPSSRRCWRAERSYGLMSSLPTGRHARGCRLHFADLGYTNPRAPACPRQAR